MTDISAFKYVQDNGAKIGFYLPAPVLIYNVTLGAASDQTLTVPGEISLLGPSRPNPLIAVIKVKQGSTVFVRLNATAAVPAGATFAQANSAMVTSDMPLYLEVKSGDVIHCITATASTDVEVGFYIQG